jgi:hypothetical protein
MKFFILFALLLTSSAFGSDMKMKYIDENCINAYQRVSALQQFFYKFEGNLPTLKDSKIKNLKFLISQYEDYKIPMAVKKKAFSDLYNDPDYYQYLLQEKSSNLIKELEELYSKSSPIKDKNLIYSLPKVSSFFDYQNPFLKIKKLVKIQNNVRDFFDELENSRLRLEQLNELNRLEKSLDKNPRNLGEIIAISKVALTGVIDCNLDYLEAERISK